MVIAHGVCLLHPVDLLELDLGDTSLTIHRFDDYCNNRQNIENNRLDF